MMDLLVNSVSDNEKKKVVNKQSERNRKTALMMAAQYGGEYGTGMIQFLVNKGVDANAQDDRKATALMMAVANGGEHAAKEDGMIKVLLDADAKADILDDDNETALMKAAQYGGKHGAR